MRYLLFSLYAPMASFGREAVGEQRPSWAQPARSAVFGLVSAALGINRSEEKKLIDLQDALHFAVRTDAPGRPLVDYHTVQTPPNLAKGPTFATRREELLSDRLETMVSLREWYSDTFFTVALWGAENVAGLLDAIHDAMLTPYYVLYVGRRSAPLGLPLSPSLHDADLLLDALAARERTEEEAEILGALLSGSDFVPTIRFDSDAPGVPTGDVVRTSRRRDRIASRSRWQFAERTESVLLQDES